MSQNPNPNNVPDATKGASDSVAAPGCVGVRGTKKRRHPEGCTCITCDCPGDYSAFLAIELTVEQFQRWLEAKAGDSATWVRSMADVRVFAEDLFHEQELLIAECRVAEKLLKQFKLEQGA